MNEKETLDTLKSIDETLKRIEHLLTPKTPHMQAVIDGKSFSRFRKVAIHSLKNLVERFPV